MNLSRRGFLKALMAGAGATAGARLAGSSSWIGSALAAPVAETPCVVVVHMVGGYNALFSSADTLGTRFNADSLRVKGGFGVDRTTLGTLSTTALDHMATIGVNHNISAHPTAQASLWAAGVTNYGIKLAVAAAGTGSLPAVLIGNDLGSGVPTGAQSGISLQTVKDLDTASSVLGTTPLSKRGLASAIAGARDSSKNRFATSPGALTRMHDAYDSLGGALALPQQGLVTVADLGAAYGFTGSAISGSASETMAASFAGAELMVSGGASFVGVVDKGWDSHGDDTGDLVRGMMRQRVVSPLKTFLDRMVFGAGGQGRNVVVCLLGDFSRSNDNSGHQPNLSVTVIGKHVQPGTTGAVNSDIKLVSPKGGITEMWAYLAAAAKIPGQPFGANPHGLVV
jgi:hypothetical protein